MRIRLVIDLMYPTASTVADEALIKHRLSSQVMAAARTKQFNVLTVDEAETIKVEEIMVGCARVEDTAPPIGPGFALQPAQKVESVDPNVYGDEDGDYWFASGHLNVADMMEAVLKWEKEVTDDLLGADDIDIETHRNYYVVPDPENDERFKIVTHAYPGAEPMTSIRRR